MYRRRQDVTSPSCSLRSRGTRTKSIPATYVHASYSYTVHCAYSMSRIVVEAHRSHTYLHTYICICTATHDRFHEVVRMYICISAGMRVEGKMRIRHASMRMRYLGQDSGSHCHDCRRFSRSPVACAYLVGGIGRKFLLEFHSKSI